MSLKALFPKKKGNRKHYEIIGFDIETTQDDYLFNRKSGKEIKASTNDFYLGGLSYNNDTYLSYFDKESMIKDILSSKHHNKLIVATNLGFDFNSLFFNTKYWDKFKIIQVNGKIIACIYNPNEDIKITFIDTGNYAPFSVYTLGEILKLPKLETPNCLGRLPKNDTELKELIIYNKRDCEISRKFVELLQEGFYNLLGGELKLTIASISMALFQRKYLRFVLKHESNYLEEEEKEFKKFLFSGYYGGRTEVFTRGKIENMYCYDVNSLYPSVMIKDYPLPQSIRKIITPDKDFFRFKGISEVKVYCPEMKYPYLPYRSKKLKKLIFPTGVFTGVYTHFELEKALSLGYKILEIKKQYIYRKGFYPFRSFVYDMYHNRMEHKKNKSPYELVFKLCLNSLYGKFAQKKSQDISFIDINNFNKSDEEKFIYENVHDNIFLNETGKGFTIDNLECESSFVIPIFSIYTTAYARDVLYNYLVDGNGFYCDTDSIVTKNKLDESNELGFMKMEYNILNGVIVKPKMYMYETDDKYIIKLKGIPTRTRDVFMKILNKEKVVYNKFTKIRESLRSGIDPNSILEVSKLVGLEDNKREWNFEFTPMETQESKALYIEE